MKRTKDLRGRVLARILAEDLENVSAATNQDGTVELTEPDPPGRPRRDITNVTYDSDF